MTTVVKAIVSPVASCARGHLPEYYRGGEICIRLLSRVDFCLIDVLSARAREQRVAASGRNYDVISNDDKTIIIANENSAV